MKRLIISVIAISLMSFLSLHSFAQSKESLKSTIEKLNNEMIGLVVAGNYQGLEKYYDADAISLPSYSKMEQGFKTILNNDLGRQRGGYKILAAEKPITEIFYDNGMIAAIGTFSRTVTFPGLQEPKVVTGKYMDVWKKDNAGNWKLVAETWNADQSPNAPQQSHQPSIKPVTPTK